MPRVLQLWGSVCFVYIENIQCRSPQQKHFGDKLSACPLGVKDIVTMSGVQYIASAVI